MREQGVEVIAHDEQHPSFWVSERTKCRDNLAHVRGRLFLSVGHVIQESENLLELVDHQ
jgi:hypothetical protein